MAPQPKRKHSGRRGRVRAKALSLSTQAFIRCSSCGKLTRPHIVCPSCGFYNGRVVIAKKEKKEKKKTEHENEK